MPARRSRGAVIVVAVVLLAIAFAGSALARWRSIGEGGCGNFDEAIASALDGDVITPMYEFEFGRNTNAALIEKNIEIEGGWQLGTGSCASTNLFDSPQAMLAAGFGYDPANHSGLTAFSEPVLLLSSSLKRLVLSNLDVMQSDIATGSGGGLRVQSGSLNGASLTITNVTFKPNYGSSNVGATGDGGALALVLDGGSTLTISNTQILNHRAGGSGGGFNLLVRGGSVVTLNRVEVRGNRAATCAGGRIVIQSGTVVINGSTFSGNLAGTTPSDLCVERAAGSTGEARLFLSGTSFTSASALRVTGAIKVYDKRVYLPLLRR